MQRTVTAPELSAQRGHIDAVRALTDNYYAQTGRRRRAMVITYGCQQNEADSERLDGMLRAMGYEKTEDMSDADLILYNTCAVRENAEQRVLGNVGAASHQKKRRHDLILGVCGCMAEQPSMAEKIKKSYPYVDLLFGPQALWRFPELLLRALSDGGRVFEIGGEGRIAEGLPVERQDRTRAWLSIMYGCNNFCTFCIVPHVRGRERSRSADTILAEARALVADGCRDITLLGQNVNSYGNDLPGAPDFADLLREINAIPGDFWVRFMTSHPKDCTPRLIETIASCDKVTNHLHLPVQSGSDDILRRMNRRYTSAHYMELVHTAREKIPDLVLTSDIIVGFPGETEEDFEATLRLVDEAGYAALFTFLYSRRTGTPAASMPDDTPHEVRQARFERLLALQNEKSALFHARYTGKTLRVLVDGESGDDAYPLSARTRGGRLVHLRGDTGLIGSFADAVIERSSTWSLFGSVQ